MKGVVATGRLRCEGCGRFMSDKRFINHELYQRYCEKCICDVVLLMLDALKGLRSLFPMQNGKG